jgi:predicted ABC-type ATPase
MKPIILLSGPVGAGKTTVARELVKSTLGPAAYIEGDKFWWFIAKDGKLIKKLDNFKMIMRSMTVAALPYARTGYEVILDFSIPPWYLPTIVKIVKARNIPLDYIVLRPSEKICAERAATRHEGIIKDYAPYTELYACFDEAERYTISDDESDAITIAEHIREGLNEGVFRVQNN